MLAVAGRRLANSRQARMSFHNEIQRATSSVSASGHGAPQHGCRKNHVKSTRDTGITRRLCAGYSSGSEYRVPNAPDEQILQLFWSSAASGNMSDLRRYLRFGRRAVDKADQHGWTALMLAARNGHHQAVCLLLEAGADKSLTNHLGQSAEDIARFWGHDAIINALQGFAVLPPPDDQVGFDRCSEIRENIDFLQAALRDSSSRFILFNELNPLVNSENRTKLVWADQPSVADILPERLWEEGTGSGNDRNTVFLGRWSERPGHGCAVYGLEVSDKQAEKLSTKLNGDFVPAFPGVMAFREVDYEVASMCRSLFAWHDRHRFCPTCGSHTSSVDGGHKRVCFDKSCRSRQGIHNTCHPRLDPTVIVMVQSADGASCLLTRQSRFPKGLYTCVSGFIEGGETVEDAVRREVSEETGVPIVGPVTYHSSQAFPFPASLMLGCIARAAPGRNGQPFPEIDLRDGELSEARWFTKKEIADVLHAKTWKRLWSRKSAIGPGEIAVPPPPSTANHMLSAWVQGKITVQALSRL